MDFEALAARINAAAQRPSRTKGSGLSYPTVFMIKISVLQQLFILADDPLQH